MASRWFVQKWESPEPIAFRELVEKVKAGELTEDDSVRAEWETAWHPARTVVGLFYSVRRSTQVDTESELVLAIDRPGEVISGNDFDSPESRQPEFVATRQAVETNGEGEDSGISLEASIESTSETPRWKQRLRQVRSEQTLPHESGPTVTQILVEAAMAEREPSHRRFSHLANWSSRLRTIVGFVRSPIAFRLVFAVMLAIVVCVATTQWARTNALRFPNPQGRSPYKMPVLGDCASTEFGILLVDLAVLSALVGYFGAKRIEVWADAR